VTYTYR